MIINDTHRFVFIHIPKCAGHSVRASLQPYDEACGRYGVSGDHPSLGRINYSHIPLVVLREHFPSEYLKVRDYAAYAILRDPFARFPSSLAQHLREFRQQPIGQLKPREVQAVVDKTLRLLRDYQRPASYLPCEYIHFQRQVDFIYDQGKRMVENIYPLTRIDDMLADVSALLGVGLGQSGNAPVAKANPTKFYRNPLIRLAVEPAKPVLKALLTARRWEAFKRTTWDWVFVPQDRKPEIQAVFDSDNVRDFIADYYRNDIRLFGEASALERTAIHDLITTTTSPFWRP